MKPKKLALSLSGNIVHYRNIVDGLGEFLQHHPEWELQWQDQNLFWNSPQVWNCGADAVVCGVIQESERESVKKFRGEVICVSNRARETRLHSVVVDDREVGRLAGRYLCGLGFRRLVTISENPYFYFQQARFAGLQEIVDNTPGTTAQTFNPWDYGGYEGLVRHLQAGITPPFAIYCVTDMPAVRIAMAAMALGLRIPEEAALLGTDNSLLLCQFSRPRLSSIELNGFALGQRVGELLTELSQSPAPSPLRIEMPPLGVVSRRSTDITALDDPRLAKALSWIREHKGKDMDVDQVAAHAGVSRRLLELRFKEILGRSPYQEILRLRMDHARELLLRTDWPIGRIAEEAGFEEIRTFNTAFRRETGMTPKQWRENTGGVPV
ncbi:MAG: helix-turn-helix domain-containing protein [Verrucomicrobia bacterium]|nr:helix-turn-helix domain-containing protein [Verrucomicrobiota bacterium]MCH8510017.1 helix-turn-helix domain-containing protein [Kiritimatiellia bacterium]